MTFAGGSNGKESAYNARGPGSSPRSGRPLEKGMATHSSILAWRTPWTEEPGGPQSIGSQSVRHDLATNTFTFTYVQGVVVSIVTITEFMRSPAVIELNYLGQ